VGPEAVRIGSVRFHFPDNTVNIIKFFMFILCYSVFQFISVCLLCCIKFSFFGTMLSDWLGRMSLK